MRIKESFGERVFNIGNIIIMLLIVAVTLYPFWYVTVASFSDGAQYMKHTRLLFKPIGFSLAAYKATFANSMLGRGYLNTLFILIVGTFLNIVMTSLGAYFLSRKNVMWKKPIMFGIVFTMYFSGGLIPFYLTVKQLHLDNTLWSLIIPNLVNTFNLIIMRTAFMAIPDSLEESAKLDGASHFTILTRLIIPLCAPTIAVMVLYYGVGYWNSWFNASIFLRDRGKFPLQLILREILLQNTNADSNNTLIDQESISETIKYALIIVSTVPVLFVYPFLQKYFVKGVMVGALKE
ncbi:carbohydrate ABC transporter permease [Clostridium oryzae]|uniref:L-arabinose transport system permease protein AraQ n=1 Tax=Clostridium oryzae TaxID=1450648 RepID=A0A1V4IBK5_9CLOT|nr:carbohydrate ABC transporter permease [Clostridium oryzae]OPJ57371.1 L-arabinose transport system permease protein AraQ [Clostridium oryzae]